jgi:hypothetical protein
MKEKDYVTLVIVNSLGQEVETLYDGYLGKGSHTFEWMNSGKPGIYHCLVKTSSNRASRRLISIQ